MARVAEGGMGEGGMAAGHDRIELFDVAKVKADFPLLQRQEAGRPIVYLDSAASSQRPNSVLEAMDSYYRHSHANVHRGVYRLAEEATNLYEAARAGVGSFIGAPAPNREVIFTKNVTEALNLVARAWGGANLKAGDVVVLSAIEHHANIVPWLMLAQERGIEIRYIPLGEGGELDLSNLDQLMRDARLVSVTMCSNVLGTLVPVEPIIAAARRAGALVALDAAQYVPHLPIDVSTLGADIVAFTGHKMLGPTGIGVLWARADLLEAMPPFLGGGEMIADVRLDGFTTAELPWKFEAGTPPIAEAVGLGAAVEYLGTLGMDAVRAHEAKLMAYALDKLDSEHGDVLTVHGPPDPARRSGVISFELAGVHPHDISQILDSRGVCIRAGHHCAKPLMRQLCVAATARASIYLYNDEDDIDALSDAIMDARKFFALT